MMILMITSVLAVASPVAGSPAEAEVVASLVVEVAIASKYAI